MSLFRPHSRSGNAAFRDLFHGPPTTTVFVGGYPAAPVSGPAIRVAVPVAQPGRRYNLITGRFE